MKLKSLFNLLLIATSFFFVVSINGCSSAVENWVDGPPQLDENGNKVDGGNFDVDEYYEYAVIKATIANLEKETKEIEEDSKKEEKVIKRKDKGEETGLPFQNENGWLLGYIINRTSFDQSVNIWNEDNKCIASFYVQGNAYHPTYLMPTGSKFYYAYWNGKSPLKGDDCDWSFQVNPWKTVSLSIKNGKSTEQKKCAWYLF